MNPQTDCVAVKRPGSHWYQSAGYSLATNGTKPFNVVTSEWLQPAVSGVSVGGKGYISDGFIRLAFTLSVGTGLLFRGVDLVDILGNIQIRDVHGVRIELTGREFFYCLYAENQMLYVGDFIDNTAGVSPLSVTGTVYFRLPCEPYGLPCEEAWWDLVDFYRGRWTFQFQTALGNGATNVATLTACTLTCCCEVTEKQAIPSNPEGVRRLRTVWRSTAMKANKDSVTTAENALHRYAFYHVGIGAAKDTPDTLINDPPVQLTSTLFGYSLLDADFMGQAEERRREHFAQSISIGNAATVLYLSSDYNPFATVQGQTLADECGVAQMLWFPRPSDLGITNLPVGSAVDYQTSQVFGTGSLIAQNQPAIVVAYIEDDPVSANHCGDKILFPAGGGKLLVSADPARTGLNAYATMVYGNKLPALLAPAASDPKLAPPPTAGRMTNNVKSLAK